MADNRLLAQYNQPSQRNALLGNVSEEDSYRDMFARDPAAASSALLAGGQPSRPEPGGFPRAMLSMMPVTGNVLAAQDAWEAAKGLGAATNEPDRRAAMGNLLLSTAGAVSPLPWGRTAGMVARDAKNVAPAFPAWHASPHDFDEFSLDKIGTGEGAQVYGHGLYMAESPQVSGKDGAYYKQFLDSHGKAHAYHVEVDAEPHQLLDWDKPLSEQSPEVRDAVKSAYANTPDLHYVRGQIKDFDKLSGQNAVQWMHQFLGPDRASQTLKEAGIPGIRYMDQGSRGAVDVNDLRGTLSTWEKALQKTPNDPYAQSQVQAARTKLAEADKGLTSNYVIFDDKLVKIKGKE